jgi:hypothetical protein
MKMHMRYNKLGLFIVPWAILLSSFLINIFIASMINVKNGFYTGGLVSIFVYMFVVSIVILNQTFPFALGLSIRRKDYILGTLLASMLVCAVSAFILAIFSYMENSLTDGWGYKIHFFSLLKVYDSNIIWQFWILFIVLTHTFLFGFVIASLYRRLGRNGMFAFFTILALLVSVLSYACTYFKWWSNIFSWVSHNPNLLSLWILLVSVVYAIVSYLLLRRATV